MATNIQIANQTSKQTMQTNKHVPSVGLASAKLTWPPRAPEESDRWVYSYFWRAEARHVQQNVKTRRNEGKARSKQERNYQRRKARSEQEEN